MVRAHFSGNSGETQSKTPDIHVVKSIITAKVTTKTVAAANSADEIVAGAYGQP